jgi:hypothetical protein
MPHSKTTDAQIMGIVAAVLVAAPAPVIAQQEGAADAAAPLISIELNSINAREDACELTFFLSNTTDININAFVLETVLLTKDGGVDRLTLFDMRDVPTGRPRVRQFNVPDLQCDALGQVLINGVATCDGDGLTPAMCSDTMTLSSRIDVEVLG